MSKIVGVGGSVYDMLMVLDGFPVEDMKQSAKELRIQCGGPCAVAMIAASKLGVPVKFIGGVGADTYGEFEKKVLTSYGVDISSMKTFEGKMSRVCLVLVNPENASRTCIGAGGEASFAMRPEDVDLSVLDGCEYVHLDGSNIEVAEYVAKAARERGIRVAIDCDVMSPAVERLLPYVNVMIPSEQFVTKYADESDPVKAARILYEKMKPELLVVTLGKKGGLIIKDGEMERYDAFSVKAVDSNGAGDIFHGAFLAACVKGMAPKEACTYASAVSAIKCTRIGGADGTPYEDEVLKFLEEHK